MLVPAPKNHAPSLSRHRSTFVAVSMGSTATQEIAKMKAVDLAGGPACVCPLLSKPVRYRPTETAEEPVMSPRAPERPREGDHADAGGQDQAPSSRRASAPRACRRSDPRSG